MRGIIPVARAANTDNDWKWARFDTTTFNADVGPSTANRALVKSKGGRVAFISAFIDPGYGGGDSAWLMVFDHAPAISDTPQARLWLPSISRGVEYSEQTSDFSGIGGIYMANAIYLGISDNPDTWEALGYDAWAHIAYR